MLLVEATNSATSETVDVYHEIKNEGKVTEEHHFSIFTKGTQRAPAGKLLFHYVMGDKEAAELKRHML